MRVLYVGSNIFYGRSPGLPSPMLSEPNVEHLHDYIYKLGIQKEDLIASCHIGNKNCSWSEILTPDGLCFAFNLVAPDEMFKTNKK